MSENLTPEVITVDQKIDNELVKANVTEAIIANLREKYLPLKIEGIEDKETYLEVKEARKECKALRVLAKKICTEGREEATAIQKAWIAKEKDVTGRIGEVEDYLEKQEKEYEAEVAKEKEARKRKQEEQLINRQTELTKMGALYSDGKFILGDVSFELSLVKESDADVWEETILPKYQEEYQKIESERIEQDRIKQEREQELKRQQEEMDRKQKELEEKEAELRREQKRLADEAENCRQEKIKTRCDFLISLGLKLDFSDNHYKGYGAFVPTLDIMCHDDEQWNKLVDEVTVGVTKTKEIEAEKERKEQERNNLQNKRYAELLPFKEYGDAVTMDMLWDYPEDEYLGILERKKAAFQKSEEEKASRIAEEATRKERERIEEEQRQAQIKAKKELREGRIAALSQYNAIYDEKDGKLEDLSNDEWFAAITDIKDNYDKLMRKQEEERKAEALAQAGDKEKWNEIMERIEAVEVWPMRSSQYRKKAAILREKLEEIKSL